MKQPKANLEETKNEEFSRNIHTLFEQITPSYDRLNGLLSLGLDTLWRKKTASLAPADSLMILDIATGTADLALEFINKCPKAIVWGVDFSSKMLAIAKEKAKHSQVNRLQLCSADAMKLPFDDESFDVSTSGFALRNMPNKKQSINEMKRVVKKDGKVIILDLIKPNNGLFAKFADAYVSHLVPKIGGIISGNREAYKYLTESINNFLTIEQIEEMFKELNLKKVQSYSRPYGIGVVCIIEGTV